MAKLRSMDEAATNKSGLTSCLLIARHPAIEDGAGRILAQLGSKLLLLLPPLTQMMRMAKTQRNALDTHGQQVGEQVAAHTSDRWHCPGGPRCGCMRCSPLCVLHHRWPLISARMARTP